MARTKKTTNTQQEKKVEEAKNASSTPISYTGSVSIQYIDSKGNPKRVVKKNNGCMPLFKFIGNCLRQEYVPSSCPSCIMLYSSSGQSTESKLGDPLLTSPVLVNYNPLVENSNENKIEVIYSFIISVQNFVSSTGIISSLGLYSNDTRSTAINVDGNRPDAYIILPSDKQIDISRLSVDTSIVIMWKLTIQNGN